MPKSLKNLSKSDWNLPDNENSTYDQINTSCLMRIADASEKMAANYSLMQSELERYKNYHRNNSQKIASLGKTVSALKGVITRMKNKENQNESTAN